MGLLQEAIKTYDCMSDYAGKIQAGKEPLSPVGHIITHAQIEITVDQEGNFVEAKALGTNENLIIIPVLEESAGRAGSAVRPHPLCDQIGYVTEVNPEKHESYMEQLEGWSLSVYSTKKLNAVYSYLKRGTILNDLRNAGLLKEDDGHVKNEKDVVCWSVTGLGEDSGPVYQDKKMFASWQKYYSDILDNDNHLDFCYLTGKYEEVAKQHMKGVVAANGNSKIISANDKTNFTFRGRFLDSGQALSIGYLSSQKAHNALKWIVSNSGVREGNRVFIAWNPEGAEVPSIVNPLLQNVEKVRYTPVNYRERLNKIVSGFKAEFPDNGRVVIAGFDAATSGRLAVTYYSELMGSSFIKRLEFWDRTCCWTDSNYGTYAPYLYSIIQFAYGLPREQKDKQTISVDDRIVPEQMQRLIHCRIDASKIPEDLMGALVHRAGNLKLYKGENRRKLLFTICAVIRKYWIDHFKEEWKMALDPNCKNRSYQFGRLLAVMEKIERDVLNKAGDDRETNAIRMQPVFVRRPGYAVKSIMDKLKTAYYPKLTEGSRVYYDRLIGEIMDKISQSPIEEYNQPLDETYLLGYYLQKNNLYKKKDNNVDENKQEEK
jgi:CRISPR-associated protein Csd1